MQQLMFCTIFLLVILLLLHELNVSLGLLVVYYFFIYKVYVYVKMCIISS